MLTIKKLLSDPVSCTWYKCHSFIINCKDLHMVPKHLCLTLFVFTLIVKQVIPTYIYHIEWQLIGFPASTCTVCGFRKLQTNHVSKIDRMILRTYINRLWNSKFVLNEKLIMSFISLDGGGWGNNLSWATFCSVIKYKSILCLTCEFNQTSVAD